MVRVRVRVRQREAHLEQAGLLPGDEAARAARAADRARQEAAEKEAQRRAVVREWAEEQRQLGGGGGGCAAPRQLQAAAAAAGVYSEVARRLMSSMGWDGAAPLGKRGEGAAEPIVAVGFGGGVTRGLGFVDTEDAELIADYLAEPAAGEPPARGASSPAEGTRPRPAGPVGGWLAANGAGL